LFEEGHASSALENAKYQSMADGYENAHTYRSQFFFAICMQILWTASIVIADRLSGIALLNEPKYNRGNFNFVLDRTFILTMERL